MDEIQSCPYIPYLDYFSQMNGNVSNQRTVYGLRSMGFLSIHLSYYTSLFIKDINRASNKDPSQQSSELKSREHERFSFIHGCKSMEELKQAHARVLKLGQFDIDSRYTGNLLAKCAISSWGSMAYACLIFRGIENPGSFEFNTMIRGYVNERDPKSAILLYREMQEKGIKPDNFTYPCLLKACSQFSAFGEGIQIHGHVFKFGFQSDLFVQNSLINMYGKSGEIKFSCRVFEQMDEMSVASWSALLASHTKLGLWGECLRLFGDMSSKGCWRADESTLVSVVSSCTHLGALDLGRCTHGSFLRNMSELNVIVQTSLIDMYVKCGSLEKGLTVFRNMSDKNQFSYSAMISGLAIHGRAEEALKVFADMLEKGLEPDDLVYVGVLTACSYGGLINEGFKYFDQMKFEHHIQPTVQHYGCLVDLMGRSGMLNEAFELIKGMPMEPNDVLWRSLLSACKVHQNIELGEVASKELFRLNQQNTSDYVILSNLYAQGHRWEDVAHTRTDMVNRGLNQIPGFSLVEVKRMVHKFLSQDKSHPESDAIYEMIQQMEWQLRFEGYLPDTTQVLFDVDEEEKKQRLSAHSQKLAIAFGLIHSSQGSAIRIVRNLRMCRDCHTYTSLISKIFDRTIVVRDRNRFHHFKDGICSCRDYW